MPPLTPPTPPATPAPQPLGKLEPLYTTNYQAWQTTPSPATRAALIRQAQPAIDQAVFSAAGRQASPNVHSRARILAAKALDSYDPQRGTLKTHLLSQLRSLQRAVGQEQQIIAIPEQFALDRAGLRRSADTLAEQLGREPSTAELADHTGLSLRRIGHLRRYRPPTASGSILDEAGEVYEPAAQLPGAAAQEDAWMELVYHDAGPSDQLILEHTLGLHGQPILENQALAAKLGVSPGAVSQRKAKLQGLLDKREEWGF